jgi:hypothetical protein
MTAPLRSRTVSHVWRLQVFLDGGVDDVGGIPIRDHMRAVYACNNPGNTVKVKGTYSFPLSIPYLASKTLTMTRTSDMVIWQ